MIVCSCKAINDTQLRQLQPLKRKDGTIRLSDAVRCLGLGTGCGRCLRHAHRVLQEQCGGAPARAEQGSVAPAAGRSVAPAQAEPVMAQ